MDVFVFPLVNVTLFPGTTKPLNVFEPRYIAMIKEAIATKTPVALAFIEDPLRIAPVSPGAPIPFIKAIAGYGYPQIIEEKLNGNLLVFLQGQGKIQLGKVLDSGTPYVVCESKIIPEILRVEISQQDQLVSLKRILVRWLNTHIPDNSQRDLFMRNVNQAEEIVGAFASYLIRDYDLQQVVLELNDINEKVRFLYRLTESNELTF